MSQSRAEGATTFESVANDGIAYRDAAQNQFDRAYAWGAERPQVSLGAAIALTVCASVATALYVRSRARARARKLAWLLLAGRTLGTTLPMGRQTGALGSGGALLLSALMLARARAGRSHTPVEELNERLAGLQSQFDRHMPVNGGRTRDLLIGAAMALGLFSLIGRLGGRGSS